MSPCAATCPAWLPGSGCTRKEVGRTSEKSDPLELVLTGEDTGDSGWLCLLPTGPYPTAVPSLMQITVIPHLAFPFTPSNVFEMGTNITIRCWNKDYGAAFLLHKDGSSPPIKHQDPSGGGAANFTLLAVTPADSGTYRCSYRPRGYPFVSSPLGDSVMLEVTTKAAPSGGSEPPICIPPVMDGWLCLCIQSA